MCLFYIGHIDLSYTFTCILSFLLMCCEWRGVFHLSHLLWPWKRSQRLKSIRIIMRIIKSRDYKKNARIIVLECMYIVQYKCIINNSGEQQMRPRNFQMHVCYLIWTRMLLGERHTSLSHTSARKQLPVWKECMANVFLTWNCFAYFTYFFAYRR